MDKFGVKKALQEIVDGNKVKMLSTDFKTHLFYKSNNKYGKPIIHMIIRLNGGPIDLHLTYDEFKEKFSDNKFYIYEGVL